MKILCAGDLHLGRTSSKLGPAHTPLSEPASTTWSAMVDLAIAARFGAVLLSGDIVDRGNSYFEALGPLQRGIERLAEAGITLVAIAGNHDCEALPRLVKTFKSDKFVLLGCGGVWESYVLEDGGLPTLRVVGWSFPAEHVTTSPLAQELPKTVDLTLPTVGLVHGDLDKPLSRYAPLSLPQMKATDYQLWILGHTHQPMLNMALPGPPVLYTGSLQALDPGEPGCHGPWAFETTGPDAFQPRQIPLSPVRYATVTVPVDAIETMEDLAPAVQKAIQNHANTFESECDPLERLSCRLHFTGRSKFHGKIEQKWSDLNTNFDMPLGQNGRNGRIAVERAFFDIQPAVNLDELKELRDPVGSVARLLLDLTSPEPSMEGQQLIVRGMTEVGRIAAQTAFQPINGDGPMTESEIQALIVRQSYAVLDTLLAQKETSR